MAVNSVSKFEFEVPDPDEDTSEDILKLKPLDADGKEIDDDPKEGQSELEIIDDTPIEDRGRQASKPPEDVTDQELESYSEKVRKRVQHLNKGYHDERRAKEQALREREELERVARSVLEENKKLRGSIDVNNELLTEQAKLKLQSEVEIAKREYKDAYEAGNSDALLEAQEKLTTARIKASKLEDLTTSGRQPTVNTVQTENPTQGGSSVDEKAAAWTKKNEWFNQDVEMRGYALGVHAKLIQQGVDPRSDEYYAAIDARVKATFPDKFKDTDNDIEDKKPPKLAKTVVAPATRSTQPKKIRLTQTQVAIAKKLGVPLELYAQKVAEEMRRNDG